jgi:hypothetical protein
MQAFRGYCWELALPSDWEARHDPECDTIIPASGIGALQLSVLTKTDGLVGDADLRDVMEFNEPSTPAEKLPIRTAEFAGYTETFDDDEMLWRRWHLRYGRHVLFITYCCDLDEIGFEDEAVDNVLASLQPRTPTPVRPGA